MPVVQGSYQEHSTIQASLIEFPVLGLGNMAAQIKNRVN
jgi:hypothetical protein